MWTRDELLHKVMAGRPLLRRMALVSLFAVALTGGERGAWPLAPARLAPARLAVDGATNPCGASDPTPSCQRLLPRLHHMPVCAGAGELESSTWHDMAAAITHMGVHHVFQGCPHAHGWAHATSIDLVHWTHRGIGPNRSRETFAGMASYQSPCSGFVTLNDEGTPCAGFRQCDSVEGVTGLNPAAQAWDVPLETRCATNDTVASRSGWLPSTSIGTCRTTPCAHGGITTANGTSA